MLGSGELVDQASREDVDALDLGVADEEPPGRADRDRDLQLDRHARAAGRDELPHAGDRLLHPERARGRMRAVVAVDPARHRVAAEVDDVSPVPVQLRDEHLEDEVEIRRQLLDATLPAELRDERLRERREAGDVREECRPVDAIRHRHPGREGESAIAGDVRLGIVERRGGRRGSDLVLDPDHPFPSRVRAAAAS